VSRYAFGPSRNNLRILARRLRMGQLYSPPIGRGLGLGVGIEAGYATLGRIGFEGRYDYGAVGSVT
jgi:class 3 adenylate cyclase